MHVIFVVGHTAGRYLLGDKEIAVQIRGNSHYRNSACTSSSQVGMLIALCIIKVSWAIRGDGAAVRCRISDLILLWAGWQTRSTLLEGYFYFILLKKQKGYLS